MKVKDLRIGNLVYSQEYNEIRTVGLIGNGHILSYEVDKGGLDGTKGIADALPIELIPERLIELGFTYDYVFCDMILIMPNNKILADNF